MSTLAEIESAADELSPEELKKLLLHVAERLERASQPSISKPRVAGLHPGAIVMAADFDAPLPDEFWLGRDA
jgi:hypothetical protein